MLIEGYFLIKQIEATLSGHNLKGVPPGSTLSKGARYPLFCLWPNWLVKSTGRLRPSDAELRGRLEALGLDVALIVDDPNGFGFFAEPQTDSITVDAVQATVGALGGLGLVCYPTPGMETVPELSWDAYEAIQKKVGELERTDPSWWTAKAATILLVVVLVLGALAVGWFVLTHYHGKR